MRKALAACGFLLLLSGGLAAAASPGAVLDTTFVANEGFLIAGGGKKVLIDALYGNGREYGTPPPEVKSRMMAGEKPFDGVDLVLVTHRHFDHADAQIVLDYLRAHPKTKLVSHKQFVDDMRAKPDFDAVAGQIEEIATEPGEPSSLTVNGITVDILCLDHSHSPDRVAETRNLAFAVKLGGVRFLHLGDAIMAQNMAALEAFSFEAKPVDLLFLLREDRSPAAQKLIAERIKPAAIVAMHIPEAQMAQYRELIGAVYPHAVLFANPMETARFSGGALGPVTAP